jgi:hypothetical protein
VGGVDTVRGIGYQQAQAVLAALDVLDRDDLSAVRVEGTDDVVDIELFGPSGALVHGSQVKTRTSPRTWAQGELLDTLRRWAALPALPSPATFEFLTDGSLGPSGQSVAVALEAASNGQLGGLAEILGEAPTSPTCQALRRARVRIDPTAIGALLLRAEQQVAAMLPDVRSVSDAQEQAKLIVGELFRLLFERAGNPDPDARVVTREQLADLVGVSPTHSASTRWSSQLQADALSGATEPPKGVVVPAVLEVGAPREDSPAHDDDLARLLAAKPAAVVAGRTGEGKSTTLEFLHHLAAKEGHLLLVSHAETYIPGRLAALVADSLAHRLGRAIPASTGRAALADPAVTLAIDGASEVPITHQAALQRDLLEHLSRPGARILLAGRDVAALRSLLPTSAQPPTFLMRPLPDERQLALIQSCVAPHRPLGANEVSAIGARVREVLGEGAGNPLLLTMAVELLEGGIPFTSRATLFEAFVDLLVARSGGVGSSAMVRVLGETYAALLDEGRRYADPYEWASLVARCSERLSVVGFSIDPEQVHATATRCGLVSPIGYTQVMAPIHDSFADYLAGRSHANGLDLPETLEQNDEQRVLFTAEIGGMTTDLATAIARYLPFLAVRAGELDHRPSTCATPPEVETLLNALLPPGVPSGVTMGLVGPDRVAAVWTDGLSSWADQATLQHLLAEKGGIVTQMGPLGITTRLWRERLRHDLRPESRLGRRRPGSLADACTLLEDHQREAAELTLQLAERIAPSGCCALLLAEIGPLGIQAIVSDREEGPFGESYSVSYVRSSTEISVTADGSFVGDFRSSRSTVEHLIGESASATAVRRVRDGITALTVRGWP